MNEKEFKAFVMKCYKSSCEQSNKNLEIMVNCFLEDNKPNNKQFYTQGADLQTFADYAGNKANLKKFLDKGAIIL